MLSRLARLLLLITGKGHGKSVTQFLHDSRSSSKNCKYCIIPDTKKNLKIYKPVSCTLQNALCTH